MVGLNPGGRLMSRLMTLDDLDTSSLRAKRVFVRVDFNVPLEDGRVQDATRIEAALPTLEALALARARIILGAHCGRPQGHVEPALSLRPVASKLWELLGSSVRFVEDCVGPVAEEAVAALGEGEVCLLENLRFHPGETAGDPVFAGRLAALAEAYVGEAFGVAHRAHASVVAVAEHFERPVAGRLMALEVEALGQLLSSPATPFVAVLGGAKIAGKIDTLHNLLPRIDTLLVAGGMANTFLAARGHDLAASLVEHERLDTAREILAAAEAAHTEVLLPRDLVVTDDLARPTRIETVAADAVPAGWLAVDIGQWTRRAFAAAAREAATLFWNGPLGVFERPPFDAGTNALAECLATAAGFTVIGGGETVAAVRRAGAADAIGHISTGGGASLALLAGKVLPGVVVLEAPK